MQGSQQRQRKAASQAEKAASSPGGESEGGNTHLDSMRCFSVRFYYCGSAASLNNPGSLDGFCACLASIPPEPFAEVFFLLRSTRVWVWTSRVLPLTT